MAYLLKVTIVWAMLLLLFELLYKKSSSFTVNRVYLLLSIAIGLLPFLPASLISSFPVDAPRYFSITTQHLSAPSGIITPQNVNPIAPPVTGDSSGWNIMLLLRMLYGTGVALLILKYLVELLKIAILLRSNPVRVVHGHKVICTGKVHSPYSFWGYIFLPDIVSVPPRELEYILQHEAAHHTRKHWLDLWIMQVITIIFWFHPLVWRYRYQLRLQHEYEADAIAAGDDPYTYGRFLIQQTMLLGAPSAAHSFHFSPIKNRINMLTKIHRLRPGTRKYLLLIPVLLCCAFLSAKPSDKTEIQGNRMHANGNVLIWRQSDTLSYDKEKGQVVLAPANAKIKPQIIVGINNEPVYRNDYLPMQATYGNTATAFGDYIKEEFNKRRANTADSLTYLVALNVLVDKKGKVVYFNARYARPERVQGQQAMWNAMYIGDTHADNIVEKIIADSPLWNPALNNGQTVNSYVSVSFPGC